MQAFKMIRMDILFWLWCDVSLVTNLDSPETLSFVLLSVRICRMPGAGFLCQYRWCLVDDTSPPGGIIPCNINRSQQGHGSFSPGSGDCQVSLVGLISIGQGPSLSASGILEENPWALCPCRRPSRPSPKTMFTWLLCGHKQKSGCFLWF